MKRLFLVVLSCTIAISSLFGQSGKVFDQLSMESSILKMDRKYAVYLPPDYDTSSRDYPVLYLLHGAGDDQTGWIQFGEVLQITDKAIKIGKATPMIIVMPDAQTGQRGYNNSPDGKWRYEDFFFEELIPHVEQQFRIKSTKEFRAVAGLSMGGGGSFIYALHRPDMFSSACPLSAYLGELNYNTYKNRLADNIPDMSEASVKSYYEKYHVLQLIESLPKEKIASVRWYIDCGDDDFLYEGNSLVHIALKKKEIKHEYRVRDGVHNWDYWRTALPEVLAFVSQSFHR